MSKKVLITGGCGFIGTNLRRQINCTVIDNLSSPAIKDNAIVLDIRDHEMIDFVEQADVVVHLAAYTSVIQSMTYLLECWDTNVNGTQNILEACRKFNKRFILASSNAAGDPISPYGASKAACEAMCIAYNSSYRTSTVCLRFSNVYGKFSQNKQSIIPLSVRKIIAGEPLIVYGSGEQTRDFVHVLDVCQAIRLCIDNEATGIYQIGSGIEISINELMGTFKRVHDKPIEIVYKQSREGEIYRNYSNIEKARHELGYEPEVELEDGIGELLRSVKSDK